MAEMEVGLMAGYMIAAGLARLAATDDALGEARREYDRAVLTEEAASREYLAAARETLGTDEARFEEAGHALKAAHEKHSQAARALNAAEREYLLALRDAAENEREARAMSNARIAAAQGQITIGAVRAERLRELYHEEALDHFEQARVAQDAGNEPERYCQALMARVAWRASADWGRAAEESWACCRRLGQDTAKEATDDDRA